MPASIYSHELQLLICERIANGEPPHVAAQCCDVSKSTHYSWIRKGQDGESPYLNYLESVKKAKAAAEAEWVKTIHKAGVEGHVIKKTKTIFKTDGTKEITETIETRRHWQAAAWMLERCREGYTRTIDLQDAIKLVASSILSGDEDVAKQLRVALQIPVPQKNPE